MKFETFTGTAPTPKETALPSEVDASSIDRVMRLDPLHMSDQDLDVIIGYYRKARALFETGKKPKRGANAAGEPVDLSGVLAAITGKPRETLQSGIKHSSGPPKPSSGLRRI